ncbi:DNA cytosine methyltransferase [Nonomuraea rhodomycinica]|uniref:DNA cytosine methyltransferase n=1 Tax=Nonomuraea rhodomycinica TaxID=1712872 RepID=A0A7Y6IWW4_9ACTN|nr:DNA cytosine methyltransferase [Nonomuraea rhodomycinica]NUW45583.1 DNA cytosine methyltransferase [Nonomuraea rhodomycinica]
MKKRILDGFCGAGGAAMGYHLAGFEVIGVDINPQPNYPFEFHQGDAIEFAKQHGHEFDAAHYSPPCQHDCTLTAGTNAGKFTYPDLLEPTRQVAESIGRPYIIEQPPGRASKRMRVDVTLCGEMFGLAVIRHRNFELGGWTMPQPEHIKHRGRVAGLRHGQWFEGPYFAVYGEGGGKGTVTQWQQAMGIDWTGVRKEIAEAIPPAYTRLIGGALMAYLGAEAVIVG